MQSSHSLLTFPLRPLPMLLQAIVLSLLVPSSLFRHLSGLQVRTFRTPAFAQSTLRCPKSTRTKAKPPASAQLSKSASPASLQGCLHCVVIHRRLRPITFATPQQHTCMAARLLPSHLFSARRTLPYTHAMLQRPSSTKTYHNVTRLSIHASC